jgi:hypothetical protein
MRWYCKIRSQLCKTLGMPYIVGFSKENETIEPVGLKGVRSLIEKNNPGDGDLGGGVITGCILWLMAFKLLKQKWTVILWMTIHYFIPYFSSSKT